MSGRKRRDLPPIPKTVYTALGPMPVAAVKKVDNEGTLGTFDFHARTVTLLKSLDRRQLHHTLRHEWVHAVLWDSGIHNLLPEQVEEAICDAIATALVAEMLAKHSDKEQGQ